MPNFRILFIIRRIVYSIRPQSISISYGASGIDTSSLISAEEVITPGSLAGQNLWPARLDTRYIRTSLLSFTIFDKALVQEDVLGICQSPAHTLPVPPSPSCHTHQVYIISGAHEGLHGLLIIQTFCKAHHMIPLA